MHFFFFSYYSNMWCKGTDILAWGRATVLLLSGQGTFGALSRISWLLSTAQIKQSTGVFAHHYNCTFKFMMRHLGWACVYSNIRKKTFAADVTVVIELPRTYPFVPTVSWRMAHAVESWFLCTSETISLFHWWFSVFSFRAYRMIWLARDSTLKWQRRI